mgnify:FL=1
MYNYSLDLDLEILSHKVWLSESMCCGFGSIFPFKYTFLFSDVGSRFWQQNATAKGKLRLGIWKGSLDNACI